MKYIILAAGKGTRLRPYTNSKPKCMVEVKGKPILHHQLDTLSQCDVVKDDIAIVGGYMSEAIIAPGIKQFKNNEFGSTNMVYTLFKAEEFMSDKDDLIISYGDIIYSSEILNKLLETPGDIVIAADLNWYDLWKVRMENPLDDAETFKIDNHSNIIELGKKPKNIDEVFAQYIGLIKIPSNKIKEFIDHFRFIDKTKLYDGKDFRNMYMTSFIQSLIDCGWNARPAFFKGGWVEIDSVDDLEIYNKQSNLI